MMNNDDLEEMMKSASKKENDDSGQFEKKRKSPLKVVIFSVLGLVSFLAILVIGAFMMNKNQDFQDKTDVPDWVGKEKEDIVVEKDVEVHYPIEFYKWASSPYDVQEFWARDEIEDDVLHTSREELKSFYLSIAWTKSGSDSSSVYEDTSKPYTNDISKRFLEDGEDNPEFSYALTEDYEKAYVTYMERLINPLFGGWDSIQSSDYVDIKESIHLNGLKDMFTTKWWDDNIKEGEDYTKLPIFAEWNDSEWDKYNLTEDNIISGFFYGLVRETEGRDLLVENIGLDEEEQVIFNVKSPVEYKAFDKDGEIITVLGYLELTLQSNNDYLDIENRVVISEAKLTIDS